MTTAAVLGHATVLYGHELDRVPITTPAYSRIATAGAEAFVHTFKRAPHSALGLRPPTDYLANLECAGPSVWRIGEQIRARTLRLDY